MKEPLVRSLWDVSREALETCRMRMADWRGRGIYAGLPDAHRCIFIHIPKTAGTVILRSLFDEPSRHVPYHEYLRANPAKFSCYFKFAFVRNPWDRLVSSYCFLRQGGINEQDRLWAERNLRRYPDFGSFVRQWVTPENVQTWPHFVPQSHFICDRNGKVMVDFVGRFEAIDRDFALVARHLGVKTTLQSHNIGNHAPFATYYDSDIEKTVRQVYAADIEIFRYDAEAPLSRAGRSLSAVMAPPARLRR